jgi:Mrp family chromosome partitioning ATPase
MSNTRLFILGIAASVLASVAVAATLGLLDDRIFHRGDAERLELLPVLAEIPLTGAPEDAAADGRRRQLAAPPATAGPGLQGSGGIGRRRLRPAVEGRSSEGVPAEPPAAVSSLAPVHAESAPAVPRGPAPLAPVAQAAGALAAGVTVATSAPGVAPTGLVRIQRAAPMPGSAPRPLMLEAPDTPAAAGFRVLRHRLAGRSGAILVTSPHAGEGKTLCALNLALALAEGGQAHVLLLEANFRRASVARLLGFHPPVCIGKQLESCRAMQERSWDVATTMVPGLHVAAVAPESELRPVANGPALGVCIEDMRRAGYDHIVVDGPAVLGSAEVNTMEEHVDGILIVLRAGESRVSELRKAVDQIGKSKLLGAVLVTGQAPDVG